MQGLNSISLGENKCNGLAVYKISSEEISDTCKGCVLPERVDK